MAGLVYICALAPDEDETGAEQQAKYPTTSLFGQIEVADGRIWMLPSGIGYFCGDLSQEEQREFVWATATPPAVNLFNEKPKGAAWKPKPSAYIVGNNDHAVHPDLERASAERMGARPTQSTAATCRCSPSPTSCSPRSATSPQPSDGRPAHGGGAGEHAEPATA